MLRRAAESVYAGKAQMRMILLYGACQIDSGKRAVYAATTVTDIDFYQYIDMRAFLYYGIADLLDLYRMIDADADVRATGQHSQTINLAHADDLIGDQHILYTCIDKDFCFADLLAADAMGASTDLLVRDGGTFVCLAVWTYFQSCLQDACMHAYQIVFECVEIDQQGRRVHAVEKIAGGSWCGLYFVERYILVIHVFLNVQN